MDQVLISDCLDLIIPDNCNLIYMDPPYGSIKEDKYYGVGETIQDYLYWLEVRIKYIIKNLKSYNLIIHVDIKCSHYIKIMVDKLIGRSNFRNEIIWGYSGPSIAKYHLPRKHDVLLWWGFGDYVFNEYRIPYKSLSYATRSPWGGISEQKRAEMLVRGKLIEDWWVDIPAIQRNELEKVNYKTQKPLALMIRLLLIFSNPHNLVLDPMCGSGSFLVAAKQLNRYFLGCDINPKAIEITRSRLSG